MIRSFKTRTTIIFLFFLSLSLVILGRAVRIQILQDSKLEHMAKKQFRSRMLVKPRRGLIYDRTGEPLAIEVESQSLAVNPSKIKQKKTVAWLLSKSLSLPFAQTYAKLSENREFLWIKRHLSEFDLAAMKRWGVIEKDGDLTDGLWWVKESKRVYPHNELAAHVLGRVDIDSEGIEGMELLFNKNLSGKVVSLDAIRDARGTPSFIDASAMKNIQEGEPLTLTLDASLQFAVEKELKSSIQTTHSQAGTVIVMNATNGEILALANYPTASPQDKTKLGFQLRRNRAITDGFEPGSTLKPILVASALQNGRKITDTLWGGNGKFKVQDHEIREAEAHEKFEWMSFSQMLKVSSNVGAAKLSLELGAEKLVTTLKSLGFGKKTQIEFPGEISGTLPQTRGMSPLTLATLGFGQGVLVTPLQIIRSYAAFANGGMLITPQIVMREKRDQTRDGVRVFSEKISEQVSQALLTVTEEGGTGTNAVLEGYKVAGKTGTAQVIDPKTRRYSSSHYVASFVGYPVNVDPKIVIFTSLDYPKGQFYASLTAAPLFKKVLEASVNRFSMPVNPQLIAKEELKDPEPSSLLSRLLLSAKSVTKNNGVNKDHIETTKAMSEPVSKEIEIKSRNSEGQSTWVVPDFRGLTSREAFRMLSNREVKLNVHGFGIIRDQSPAPGSLLTDGQSLSLVLNEK